MPDARDLTTVDAVKAMMAPSSLGTASLNVVLDQIVSLVSAEVVSYLSRDLAARTIVEVRNGNGQPSMRTLQRPLVSVASVTVNDVVVRPCVTRVDDGFLWTEDDIMLRGYVFDRGAQNVVLTYAAGWNTPGMGKMLTLPARGNNTTYAEGTIVVASGLIFQVVVPGTSHVSVVPTWPTSLGVPVTDGTVVWVGTQANLPFVQGAAWLPSDISLATTEQCIVEMRRRSQLGDTGLGIGAERVNYLLEPMHKGTKAKLDQHIQRVPVGI